MNRPQSKIAIAAALSLAFAIACDGDAGNKSSSDPDRITALCEFMCSKAKSVNCPAEINTPVTDCIDTCEHVAEIRPACRSTFEAYMNCGVGEPMTSWECDSNQEADLKPGICTAESDAMDACVAAN